MLSTPTKYLNHVISILLLNYLYFELVLHISRILMTGILTLPYDLNISLMTK